MKPFCIIPWTNLYLSPIGYGPECSVYFKNDENTLTYTIEQIYNSEGLQELRKYCMGSEIKSTCLKCKTLKNDAIQMSYLKKMIEKGGKIGENSSAIVKSYLNNEHLVNAYPPFVSFEVSYHCNLKCIYCDLERQHYSYNSTLINSVFNIADRLIELHLTGGEPLINKEVINFISIKKKVPSALSFTTNGTVLNDYLPMLKEYSNLGLYISLDTLDKKLLETERSGVNYDKLMENIYEVISLKRQKHDLTLGFSVCITKANIQHLHRLINWSIENGVDIIQFCYLNGDPVELDVIKNPNILETSERSFFNELQKSLLSGRIQFINEEPLVNFIKFNEA